MWAYTDSEIDYLSSSWTRAAHDRPEPAAAAARHGLASRLRRVAGAIPAWWQRHAERAQLEQLDDRTLADLALNRGDFPAILAGTFTRDV